MQQQVEPGPQNNKITGPVCAVILCAVFLSTTSSCEGGTSSPPDAGVNECDTDKDCDDEIGCTHDMCVVSVNQMRKCWHEPDSSLCPPGETCRDALSVLSGCHSDAEVNCTGKAEGDACEPDDPCATGVGECRAGRCEYPKVDCQDRPCHEPGECDTETGSCEYEALPDDTGCLDDWDMCRPGLCVSGVCVAEALECDDEEQCTVDTCDHSTGCVYEPLTGDHCDDNDACTGPDSCLDGVCEPGPNVSCDDNDLCTTDSCDTSIGCVNQAIAPCCGNYVVEADDEADEQCDAGPSGTNGCSKGCAFTAVTLAAPPEPGRHPATAWSDASGTGMVLYDIVREDGYRSLMASTVDPNAQFGDPVTIGESDEDGVIGIHSPGICALGPSGDFLVALYGEDSLDLSVIDKHGVIDPDLDAALPLGGDEPGTRIGMGTLPSMSLVAWEATRTCEGGAGTTREVFVSRVVHTPDLLMTGEPSLLAGGCDPVEITVLGGVCASTEAALLTLSTRKKTRGSAVSAMGVVPFPASATVPGQFQQLDSFEGDIAVPPICTAAPDGSGFLVIYMKVLTQVGGDDEYSIQIWSRFVGLDGKPVGAPSVIESQDIVPGEGYSICHPALASITTHDSGGYVMTCAVMTVNDDTGPTAKRLFMYRLNDSGLPVDEPTPLPWQTKDFAATFDTAPGPGDSVLVAWHGAAEMMDDMFNAEPSLVRAVFFGRFPQ